MNTTTLLPLFLSACGGSILGDNSAELKATQIDSSEVRDAFTPTVSAFNRAGAGFCVGDSPNRTMMGQNYEIDISSEIGYVSPGDQITRVDGKHFWSCLNHSADTGVATDYFDDAFQKAVGTYLQARQGEIENGFYFTAGARAIVENNGLAADKFFEPAFVAAMLQNADGVIIAAHDENVFGDNGVYGRAVYRSSLPNTLEIYKYNHNVLAMTEGGLRLIDLTTTQLIDLAKVLEDAADR